MTSDAWVEVSNNYIRIDSTFVDVIDTCKMWFVKSEDDKMGSIVNFWVEHDDGLYLPRGLEIYPPINAMRKVNVENSVLEDIPVDSDAFTSMRDMLQPSLKLRQDQVLVAQKALYYRRGIVQLATGSGKTEIFAAMLKAMEAHYGYMPKTLVLEPSLRLVDQTCSRLQAYGISAIPYSSKNQDAFTQDVIVAHPKSLYNDLQAGGASYLSEVSVFICDEGHHISANMWQTVLFSLDNVEYAWAFSALVVNVDTSIAEVSFGYLSVQEALAVAAVGDLIVSLPATYYVERGILAIPVVFRIYHQVTEALAGSKDWHELRSNCIEADRRNDECAKIALYFAKKGFKVLVLVGTKRQAERILDFLVDYGVGELAFCSYGGEEFFSADGVTGQELLEAYNKGERLIMLGTSHVYEGFDVPYLDAVVLANVGKNPRRLIQAVGRSLRKTKKGSHAYVIDFTDYGNDVLSRHSNERAMMFQSLLGVKNENIYNGILFTQAKAVIGAIENKT